jgi:hypothetical protein
MLVTSSVPCHPSKAADAPYVCCFIMNACDVPPPLPMDGCTHHLLSGGEAKLPVLAVTRHLRVSLEVICKGIGKLRKQVWQCIMSL